MINPQELLFSVDENNNPITPQPRALSHQQHIWHRSTHVWIYNSKGELLCQQRSLLKDANPGKWESFFGGHLGPKQTYRATAITEVREEIGVSLDPSKLCFVTEFPYAAHPEFVGAFAAFWDGDISEVTPEADEVEQVAWKSIEEVTQHVTSHDPAWTDIGYEPQLLAWLAELRSIYIHDPLVHGTKGLIYIGDDILVYRRDTHTNLAPLELDLPGGGQEAGESPLETFIRETSEEFNLTITPHDVISAKRYKNTYKPEKFSYFLVAKLPSSAAQHVKLGDEGTEWMLLSPQEFIARVDTWDRMRTRAEQFLNSQVRAES